MKKAFFILILFINSCIAWAQADSVKDTTVMVVAIKADSTVPVAVKVDTATVTADEKLNNEISDLKKDIPSLSDLISIGKVFWAIVFLFGGYFTVRFIGSILEKLAEKSTNYRITIKGLVPVIKISVWMIVLFIIIMGIFHPPVNGIIAATASIGIAVGFAAQDILKNIFGGIMILFDRPFQVGDKIEIGEYYGEVLEIGLRSTRIVTPDDSLVSVPNGELMNKSVSNSNTGEANCQVVAEIYLPITVDTAEVRKIAIESAQVSRFIYLNKPITVLFFNEVKERRSYLKMRLKAYVSDIRNEFAFKSDMTEIVMRELLSQKVISPDDLK
ncbi:mechanosensitive ion channel family protein [Fulvivirga ligni]|uniref:mechanosensitive ion channel family protein n=1 Tax=Fulvivirga ligni TaxID=2904246 RepID=UPI001F33422A|nr:mechanosensitive ion channel domain-containing protein [Fulvivirga ligni]UII23338.1 mechanosensitive ion channel family protein [Fulvivirga ligni]